MFFKDQVEVADKVKPPYLVGPLESPEWALHRTSRLKTVTCMLQRKLRNSLCNVHYYSGQKSIPGSKEDTIQLQLIFYR